MGATVESVPSRAQGLRSSGMRRPVSMYFRGCRVKVDPDGAVRAFHSLAENRALFGHEQVQFSKVQAGIVVHAQRPDWTFRLSSRSVQLAGRLFDGVEVIQSIEFHRGKSQGYVRRVRLRNSGQGPVRLRLVAQFDPTAAHYDSSAEWGSLGVNAFNRESHVAMDEVSDPPSARVVGAAPSPAKIYMTDDRGRAKELLAAAELPENTAGMSGQVLILTSHELELGLSESKEVTFASLYNPGKLEDALTDFGRLQSQDKVAASPAPLVACSDRGISEAASWAVSVVEAGAYSRDSLDRYEVLRALSFVDPPAARRVLSEAKALLRKDGALPHSLDPSRPGVLETAVFLRGASAFISQTQDKKQAKAEYPFIKKLAGYLLNASKDFAVRTDPSLPQGWRRRLGRGFPTGEIPEVSLAVAGALQGASQVSRLLARSEEGAKFRERAEMVADHVRKKLVDERGYLALCKDSAGRVRVDETIDMAVAAYRHHSNQPAEQASVHRLLEKDFDTPFGPRCVPTTNQVYFNPAYGQGQLGGVWTRAVLAYSMVCYGAGLGGMGSLALGKVARLVSDEAPRLGGVPGEFPLWVDVEGAEIHGEESDPVAAARFLGVLLEGELGIPDGQERAAFSPSASSGIAWVMASDVFSGEQASVFVGRNAGRNHTFYVGGKADAKGGNRFAKSERADTSVRGVYAISFNTPGQVICVGNTTGAQVNAVVNFSPRAADLSKHLSASLEAYDPTKGSWSKSGTLRITPSMSFETSLGQNDWKAFRLSTP